MTAFAERPLNLYVVITSPFFGVKSCKASYESVETFIFLFAEYLFSETTFLFASAFKPEANENKSLNFSSSFSSYIAGIFTEPFKTTSFFIGGTNITSPFFKAVSLEVSPYLIKA